MEISDFFPILLLACVALLVTSHPADDVISVPETLALPQCPRTVSRKEWKARKARSTTRLPISPTPYVVIHHGGMPRYCFDQAGCSAIARSYQNFHMDEHRWDDIGYSFLVAEDGNAYEGRGWDRVGAHAPKYNNQSIGICLFGDFTKRMPNEAALRALNSLIACGVALGKIREDYHVVGHRQVRDTECPGETFYKYVQRLPHWTDKPVPVASDAATSSTSVPTPTLNL